MNPCKYLSLAVVGVLAFSVATQAGNIDVVNENKKSLKIKIEAEGEPSAVSFHTIPSEQNSSFEIKAEALNGKSHYSIKGDTNPFTLGDKCQHLSVEKDYKVTFLNDKLGTTCVAEEAAAIKSAD